MPGGTKKDSFGNLNQLLESSTASNVFENVKKKVAKRAAEKMGRFTKSGKYIHSLEETKKMDFPYPPEPELY